MHSRSLDSAEAIDLYYNNVISIISSSSEKHLPYRKGFKQHLKPYWDDTLKDLHKSMRDLRRAWVLENRPRGNCYETYRVYKQAKRLFRQYHRKCADNHLKSLNEEIDRAAEVSSEYFWRLVNKRKNTNSGNVGCEIIFQDKTCRDSEEICNGWGNYFSALYSATDNENYDSEHYNNVTARVEAIKRNAANDNSMVPIRKQELDTAISELNRGKASVEDRIDNEHIVQTDQCFGRLFCRL